MATDPSEFVSIFSPGGTKLTLPPASPAGSEAGGVGSAQSSQTPAQQGAAGSVVQKILGGPSGSIGSVGGGSDTAGSKTGATEPVTPAPVSPARIGDGPGEQRTGAQSPPVMMSPEMLKTILAESMAMGMAERVLGLLKNPLFGHFPGIASPALGLGCLPRGKSFGARADLFWHGGSGLLALLVRPGRPVFNTLLRHN